MDAGELLDRDLERVPLLAHVRRKGRRRLSSAVERVSLPRGAVVQAAGRPVHWVAFVVDGQVVADGSAGHRRERWTAGDAIGLAEGLRRDVAPSDAVTATD